MLESDRHRVLRASAAFRTWDNRLPGQPALGLCNRAHVSGELRPYGRAMGVVRPRLPDQRQRALRLSAVPQHHPSPHELTLFCDTELFDHLAEAVVAVGGHGSDAHVRRWCDSWERCSEIQPWLMMPRLDSLLCHQRLKAVQTVRLSPIAIKMAMVILADPGRVRSTRLSCFAPRGIRRAF